MIAVNDAYLWAPWADVCYFADSSWWDWQRKGIAKPKLGLTAEQVRERFANFAGEKCSIQNSGGNIEDPAVHILRNANYPNNGTGISLNPEMLVTGSNSSHQALNVAILAAATTVILLGVDGRPAADGQTHFFGDHPRVEPLNVYPMIVQAFRASAKAIRQAGVRVINCSPESAVDCFERMELEQALRLQLDAQGSALPA